MKILGISAFYHDSAAAIIENGKILAAAQEERFTRKKQDASFPTEAVKYCLKWSGFSIDELDAVVFYDKPLLKFERLLQTYYSFAPKGIRSFITAIPVWLNEKMFLKRLIRKSLSEIENYNKKQLKLLFPEHHLSHAASAFFASPFEDSAILTVDGVGEWATASICYGSGNQIKKLKELEFPHSLGLLYSAFTYFLGFKVNSGEYKLMGLAPYGNPFSERTKKYIETIKSELIDIKSDGSIWLNQKYFNYATGLRMVYDKKWERLFGFPKRNSESELQQEHCDLAFAVQAVTEEVVLKLANHAKALTNSKNLCMAGGVALNCVANGKLEKEGTFENIFIQPAAGDAGGALGAALASHFIYFQKERKTEERDLMQGAYLGPRFDELEIELMAKKFKAKFEKLSDALLMNQTADMLQAGNVIGWFQGRMEWGPRALGNRSILGDSTNPEMQKKINLKIKYRESFRPFAPSILEEDVTRYFDLETPSPYMLFVAPINDTVKNEIPENYWELPLKERLYQPRSEIQSVTHVDFTGRIQSVSKITNPKFHQLLSTFKEKTGHSILINTSFNVRGEPIVCTPEDAYRCFMRTEMDYLVIENYIFDKKQQPDWQQTDSWQEEFMLD